MLKQIILSTNLLLVSIFVMPISVLANTQSINKPPSVTEFSNYTNIKPNITQKVEQEQSQNFTTPIIIIPTINENNETLTETTPEVTSETTTVLIISKPEPKIISEPILETTTVIQTTSLQTEALNKISDNKFEKSYSETEKENSLIKMKQKNYILNDNDTYWNNKYEFKNNSSTRYSSSVLILGDNLVLHYVDKNGKWIQTKNYTDILPKTDIYFNTDTFSGMFSLPSVYQKQEHNTIKLMTKYEQGIKITKEENGYRFTASFPENKNYTGEWWGIYSRNDIVDWNNNDAKRTLAGNILVTKARWLNNSYYFPTPSSYLPSGENIYYSIPTCYTGCSYVHYKFNNFTADLGYIMMKECINNQNSNGFWYTEPASKWLNTDWNIGNNFYDTRFNNDFATGLIYAYKRYNEQFFLDSAIKYGDFYVKYTNEHSYQTKNGILVQDYTNSKLDNLKTHTSLNHHLSGINFLYKLYLVTNNITYLNTANKMLKGIDDTKSDWVMPDHNLKYCLYYTKSTNTMVDYPYLTYDDMFETQCILEDNFGGRSATLDYLMKNKKLYMDSSNIKDYRTIK